MTQAKPLVGIIMGSRSDWETMSNAAAILTDLGVPHECKVVSAHRTPERLYDYALQLVKDGKAYVQAGGGWVNDSTPEAEYQETVNKSKAMLKAVALAENFRSAG